MQRFLALSAVAAGLLAGCGGEPKPDPRLIVFARAPATNAFSDLYLLQTDGSLRRLTHGGIDGEPMWSPDGRLIAFQRTQRHRNAGLYVANADGSGYRRLPGTVSDGVDWAPDDRRLVYVEDGRIYVTNDDWSERTLLLDPGRRRAAQPRWSRDGSRIVFVLGDYVHGDVWSIGAAGGSLRRLTHVPPDRGLPDAPMWSPDGERVAYLLPGSLHVVNADGTEDRELARFPPGIFPSTPAWSPDGRSIAYARLKLGRDRTKSGLYVVDVDSGRIERLTRDIDSAPSWSPDGRQLVFQRLAGFHISEITLMDRNGSNQVSLTGGGWSDTAPAWRPQAHD